MKIEFDIDFSARRATEGWFERHVGNGPAGVRNPRGWNRVRVWESASVEERLRLDEVRPQVSLARRGGKPRASVRKVVGREKARAQPRGGIECGGWSENKIKIRAFVVELCCVASVATQGQINFERRS